MLAHLADISVRSLLLALPALIVPGLLRRKATAAWQHAVCLAVVCGMLYLFAFGQILPRIPLRVLDNPSASVQSSFTGGTTDSPVLAAEIPTVSTPVRTNTRGGIDWGTMVLFAYGAIAFGFLMQFATGVFLVRRLISVANPVSPGICESPQLTVPVTVGWLRPLVMLPRGWREWKREKLDAVLAHEGAHVRRRDGLAAALAHVNRSIFWFHPLAWILERRLALLAEKACDESCVAALGDRARYAQILLEMATVVDCSRGRLRRHTLTMAAGSHIHQRIDLILEDGRTFSRGLTGSAWVALMLCGIPFAVCAGAVELDRLPPVLELEMPRWSVPAPPPLVRKLPEQPLIVAQAAPVTLAAHPHTVADDKLSFEVVSIKLAPPDDGRNMASVHGGLKDEQISYGNVTMNNLIYRAYPPEQVYKILGAIPAESSASQHYDVIAKIPPGTTKEQFMIMMRNMLHERFGLVAHGETREFAGYDLVVAKGGPKLKEAAEVTGSPAPPDISKLELDQDGFPKVTYPTWVVYNTRNANGVAVARLTARAQPVSALLTSLRSATGRPVQDKTGLTGKYDFNLEYDFGVTSSASAASPSDSASAPDPGVNDILYAIRKLGLTVEPTRVTLGVLVVDHVEKTPTEN